MTKCRIGRVEKFALWIAALVWNASILLAIIAALNEFGEAGAAVAALAFAALHFHLAWKLHKMKGTTHQTE